MLAGGTLKGNRGKTSKGRQAPAHSRSIASDDRAFEQACRFLARRARTAVAVEGYLEARGYGDSVVGHVLQSLARLGYINDLEFARARVEQALFSQGWGPAKVAAELVRRGLDEALVKQVLDEVMAEVPEAELARRVVEKRLSGLLGLDDRRQKLKIFRLLLARGFEPAVAMVLLGVEEDELLGG